MKFFVDRARLAAALRKVAPIVARMTVREDQALLRAEKDQIIVEATDLNVWAELSIPADVEEPGSVVVDFPRFEAVAKAARADSVKVAEAGDADLRQLVVSAGRSRSKIPIPSLVEDWFDRPAFDGEEIELDVGIFDDLVRRGRISVAKEEGRYAFDCVFLRANPDEAEGSLVCVTTDGRRLTMTTTPIESGVVGAVLVPSRSANTILALLPKTGTVRLLFDEKGKFCVRGEGFFVLVGTRNPENFPASYDEHILSDRPNGFRAAKSDVLGALAHVSAMLTDESRVAVLDFRVDQILFSSETHRGSAEDSVVGEGTIEGTHQYDPDYLADGVGGVTSDEVLLLSRDSKSGLVVEDPGEGPVSFRYLTMPIIVE